MYEYQETGVNFLIKNQHALLADEMGLGKTIQVIKAFNKLKISNALIICPTSVKINWLRELNEWLDSEIPVSIITKGSDILFENQITIINYDLLRKNILDQIRNMKFDCIVCDEAHYLKNMKALRTKAVLGKNGIIRNGDFKWMLTGTPVLNRPLELAPMLLSIGNDHIDPFNTYNLFIHRYCGAFFDGFKIDATGASNIVELKDKLKNFMLRREKKNVLQNLPEKTYQTIYIEYDALFDRIVSEFKEETEIIMSGQNEHVKDILVLGRIANYRKEIALAKIQFCYEHIEDVIQNQGKAVVYAYHRDVIFTLAEYFKNEDPAIVMGGQNANERQKQIDKFVDNPECKLFLGNIRASGQGIDGLQNVCSNVIFVESDWTPGVIDQAIDRCHRIGQKNNVHTQFLVVENTIEETMVNTVHYKRKLINKIIKGENHEQT